MFLGERTQFHKKNPNYKILEEGKISLLAQLAEVKVRHGKSAHSESVPTDHTTISVAADRRITIPAIPRELLGAIDKKITDEKRDLTNAQKDVTTALEVWINTPIL